MISVHKLNTRGEETWRYTGEVMQRFDKGIVIRARFNRPDVMFHGVLLRQGDPFIETYYTDRWYNIFEVHDVDDDAIKGWYCNIARPAVLDGDEISFVDLALDLLVYPDGTQLVLDEDEFAALQLDPATQKKALEALEELRQHFGQLPSRRK